MMTHTNPQKDADAGRVDGALRWIGDLDHPFYSDERNRYVWYEASAIAFQLLFIGSYLCTGAVLWLGGASAMPYTLALFVPTMIAAVVFQAYLKRNSAEYWPGKNDLVRRRGQLNVLAGVFLVTGLIRATIDLNTRVSDDSGLDSFTNGAVGGAIAGLLIGPLAAVAVLTYKRRQADRAEETADDEF